MIAMPIDPQHAIVLHPLEQFPLPGLYPVGSEIGKLLNGAAAVASRRWLVVPSGRAEVARHAIYRISPGLRKADLHPGRARTPAAHRS
jgi:hypothetical protein